MSYTQGKALTPLTVGGSFGDAKIPAAEFTPDRKGTDDIGTYTFRYRAVSAGTSKLRFVYVYPGGLRPTGRSWTCAGGMGRRRFCDGRAHAADG
jgi:hypothetical protein